MFEHYHYTDTEVSKLLKSIVILCDTREQSNAHITDWFDKHKILYKTKALKCADYSFMIPANAALNIDRDMYFSAECAIERKHSLEELSGNFTKDRDRIEKEFAIYPGKLVLLVENASYKDVVLGNYSTQYSAQSFAGTLFAFWHRYNVPVIFIPDSEFSGRWIYSYFYYYLRNQLKG